MKGDQLIVCKSTNYRYTANEITITTEGFKNGTSGDWLQLNQATNTFDEDSVLSCIVSHPYEQPAIKETYSYDGDRHIKSLLTETWDGSGWVNSKTLEYNYDANGHLVLAEIKTWQEGTFIFANRAVYELDEVGNPIVVNFEKWNDEEWEQGTWQSGFYVFSESHLKRQNDFICRRDAKRIEIHYAVTPLPNYYVENHQAELEFFTIHPNPTNGLVTITGKDLKQAEVINTLGQRVAKVQGEGETLQIDIANLPAGVYFVNVTDGEGKKCVRKVVKE